MSLYTITMMVKWAIETDEDTSKILDNLRLLNEIERKNDPRLEIMVNNMYDKWSKSTNRIEKLALLGWKTQESIYILSELIEQLPELRIEYEQNKKQYGNPILNDNDLEQYEEQVNKMRKEL